MFKNLGLVFLFLVGIHNSVIAKPLTLNSLTLINNNLKGDLFFRFPNGWEQRVGPNQTQDYTGNQLVSLSGKFLAVTVANAAQATMPCGSFVFNGTGMIKAALLGTVSQHVGRCVGYFK